jgi:hypothetical protein
LVALTLSIGGGALASSASASDDAPNFGGSTNTQDQSLEVEGLRGSDNAPAHPASSTSEDAPVRDYLREPYCNSPNLQPSFAPTCTSGQGPVILCIDGTEADLPLWVRTQNADGTWTQWELVSGYTCPGDAPLLAAIQREWTQLQPEPSAINLQPNTGWVIATVPTVATAGDGPRLQSAVLLGADVDIRATAQEYRWEWGDGTHTSTTDPGQPYPNATLTHTYAHASDVVTVTLTTTWSGQYRVNGGPWVNFDSTINSDSTPVQLTIYDPRSRLVDCDLDGHCVLEASA